MPPQSASGVDETRRTLGRIFQNPDHPCICTRAGSNPHTCQSRFEIERTRSRGVLRVSTAGKQLRGGESEVLRALVVGAEFAIAIAIARLCGRRKYVREDIAKV